MRFVSLVPPPYSTIITLVCFELPHYKMKFLCISCCCCCPLCCLECLIWLLAYYPLPNIILFVSEYSISNAVNSEELVPLGDKSSADGWHIIQFSGGKNAPTRFDLTLFWKKNSTRLTHKADGRPLLKLRTDVDRITPKTEQVLLKLPPWCSLFGKSTSPHTLAFLTSLPVNL